MKPIGELVNERRALAEQLTTLNGQLSKLNAELTQLDRELFARIEAAVSAFGFAGTTAGSPPAIKVPPALPATQAPGQLLSSGAVMPHAPAPLPTPAFPIQSGIPVPKIKRTRRNDGGRIFSAVIDVLRAAEGPMKTADVFAELARRNVHVVGKEPMNNLSALLSRNRELFERSSRGWSLIGKPHGGGT